MQCLIQYGSPAVVSQTDDAPAQPAQKASQDSGERRKQIVVLRGEGRMWQEVAAEVGLSPSRVRAVYDQSSDGAQRRVDDVALLANLRLFLADVPDEPSRRAYGRWSGRIVTPATVENRFGSWTRALAMAAESYVV